MKIALRRSQTHAGERRAVLYLHDGSHYHPSRGSAVCVHEDGGERDIVVTGAFPVWENGSKVLVETIRDRDNPKRLAFLVWEKGSATVRP